MRSSLVVTLVAAVISAAAAASADPRAALTALEAASPGITVSRAPATGLARFVTVPASSPGIAARGAGSEARARAFLDRYGAAFGIGGRTGVRVLRVRPVDAVGMEHLHLQQEVDGVPLRGGELTVHLRGGAVGAVLARTLSGLDGVDLTPRVDTEDAEAAARTLAAGWVDAVGATFSTPRLELFNRALLTGVGTSPTRLAWFVEALTDVRQEYIWVDAQNGAVLFHFNQRPTALVRQIQDAANVNQYGPVVRNEGDGPTGNVQVDNAYDFCGDFYAYYAAEHGRDGYDGAGGIMSNVVRSCPSALCFGLCPCPNAFNVTFVSFFGEGWVTDDLVAHEWTHAVTAYAAGLYYVNQSGALNESFSDIFGEVVDLTNAAGTDTPAVRWRLFEDLAGGGIRDMMNPNLFNDPGKVSDPQVVCGSFDDGGVHTNSGIPNHAFALMVDGGTYNGFTISGIGLTKVGKIQYRALNDYLVSTSTLADAAAALAQSCTDLIGTAGISAADCTEVNKAIDAVEMGGPWPCDPCGLAPRSGCRTAGKSSLRWQHAGGAEDRLLWKWTKGQSTTVLQFADPTSSADYALCIYAGGGGTLLAELDVAAHPLLWRPTAKGFKYKDALGAASGVSKLTLKSSAEDKAKIVLKSGGTALPDPGLGALATPVRVQLVNLETSVCWEGAYDGAAIKTNAPDDFKATATN